MTSLTLAEAANLSRDPLIQGVAKEILTVDLFSGIIPFKPTGGRNLLLTRELTEAGATFLDVNSNTNATPGTVTQISFNMGRIVGDAEVDDFEQLQMSEVNDQQAVQITLQSKRIGRKWKDAIITGTGSFPNFSGISVLNDASQIVEASSTTTGAALTLALLDELIDLVTISDGEVDFIIMNAFQRRAYRTLLRTQGLNEQQVEVGFINPITGVPGKNLVMSYDNIPVFKNGYLSNESTNGATDKGRIYAGVLGEENEGLFGIMPADNDPAIRISVPFISQDKDATIRRVKMFTGLALKSTKAIAKLGNLVGV